MTLRTFFCCLYSLCCLALLAMLLTGCAPAALAVAEEEATLSPATLAAPLADKVNWDEPTVTPQPTRRATLSELANDVLARISLAADLAAAREGDAVDAGGLVRTGAESKVRLTFTEGTIVRLGAHSEFTVTELRAEADDPFTRIQLVAGQLWVILMGGSLEVETPAGVASVRGSYLGVNYDPQTQTIVVTCLEGECGLSNDAGEVALTDGQTSQAEEGEPPTPPEPLAAEQIEEWTEANPEAEAIVEEVYPEGTPTPDSNGGSGDDIGEPLRYSVTNYCTYAVTIGYGGPESGSFSLAPGEGQSGELPPGDYVFTSSDDDSQLPWSSANGPLSGGPCDHNAPPGSPNGTQPVSTPVVAENTQPLRYTLIHNCPPDPQTGASREGVWEWTFDNVSLGQTFTVSVNPGSTESGELPPGHYRVSDRDNTGPLESGEFDSDQTSVYVARCGQ
ncbi:MAG: FecR family protein [Anaerolineales bacterium]